MVVATSNNITVEFTKEMIFFIAIFTSTAHFSLDVKIHKAANRHAFNCKIDAIATISRCGNKYTLSAISRGGEIRFPRLSHSRGIDEDILSQLSVCLFINQNRNKAGITSSRFSANVSISGEIREETKFGENLSLRI